MTESNAVPLNRIVEDNTHPIGPTGRSVEVRVSFEKIQATVAPEHAKSIEGFMKWMLQQQANQTAALIHALFSGLSKGDGRQTTQAIAAHMQASAEGLTLLHQIVTQSESRIAVAGADVLGKLKLPE